MDSFQSESLSSDSASSEDHVLLENSKKEVRKRKIRATEEFVPVDQSSLHLKDPKEVTVHKRQKISFLPKIDDLMEDGHEPKTDINQHKHKHHVLSNTSTKTPTLKLQKFKIKRRNKIIKPKPPTNKKKLKDNNPESRPMMSGLLQVLSDAAAEFRSDTRMSLKLKREEGGWKSVSREESQGYSPRIVLKDFYVNLTPLEKTNLLSEKQLRQLQCRKVSNTAESPLLPASCSSHHTPVSSNKLYLGKENMFEWKVSSVSKVSQHPKKCQHKSRSLQDNFCLLEYYRPCKVFLERLSPDQIELLTSLKGNPPNDSGDASTFEQEVSDEEMTSVKILDVDRETALQTPLEKQLYVDLRDGTKSIQAISTKMARKCCPLSKSPDTSRKSIENAEEPCLKFGCFHPGESSSPLVPFCELITEGVECVDIPSAKTVTRRLTYDVHTDDNRNLTLNQPDGIEVVASPCEDLNGTYEVQSSSSNSSQRTEAPSYLHSTDNGAQELATSPNKTAEELSHKDGPVAQKTSHTSTPRVASSSVEKRRRSTLTLEDSVIDISLLKSTCDSNGTPQKLTEGRRHSYASSNGHKDVSFRKVLVTKLKSRSFHDHASGKGGLPKPPYPHYSNVTMRKHSTPYAENVRVLLKKTQLCDEQASPSSNSDLENTSPPWDRNSTYELEESQFNKTDDLKIIENTLDEALKPCDTTKSESFTKEARTVTFDKGTKDHDVSQKTPKSVLKSKSSPASNTGTRRVTFSNVSVIIIDDSDVSRGSPVPTQFPLDDDSDDSVQELSSYNMGPAGRTPRRGKKSVNSEQHKKGSVSVLLRRTKKSVDIAKDRENSCNTSRSMLLGSPVLRKTPKRVKMPDFAKIHKKIYDNMLNLEEYSQKKKKRAQVLLSGQKPADVSIPTKTSSSKHVKPANTRIPKLAKSKKQLQFAEDSSSSATVLTLKNSSKKVQLASSTPIKKKELGGSTRYGFKAAANDSVTKKEQKMAVANKSRPLKSNKEEVRNEIKGVRSNRRFELLMKMRQKKQK